ncbi:MAG: RluA family pseudouridine synthase [Actinomycetota bacterium]|nr:RluA family pseudouridine synthase [Actinomycetota bacterium]
MSRIEFLTRAGGVRLDAAVAEAAGISRTLVARLIEGGKVLVDGVPRSRSYKVSSGQVVSADVPDAVAKRPPAAEDIDVVVRYEDESLLVVSKPAGLVVHPGPGHESGTLVNALLARAGRPSGGEAMRPGIVHRLDAGTSGLMIVAKDEMAFDRLSEMMANREVSRTYIALVEGIPSTTTGTIDAPIGRSPKHRKKMAVVAGGRDAVTDFRVKESFADAALLEVKPRTGRTHQIRVHLAAAGHAVVGDAVYGKDRKLARRLELERPFLHAAALRFAHPLTGAPVEIDDPMPEDLTAALAMLRAQ